MAKSNLSLSERQIVVNANVQSNSEFNGVDEFETGELVDFTTTTSEKKDTDGNPIQDSEGNAVHWTLIKYRDLSGRVVPAWVGSDRIAVDKGDIGKTIQVKYTVFEATKEYKAGKIKVGDITQVVRDVVLKALDFESRADTFAKSCAKYGIAPAFAG